MTAVAVALTPGLIRPALAITRLEANGADRAGLALAARRNRGRDQEKPSTSRANDHIDPLAIGEQFTPGLERNREVPAGLR